MSTMWLDSIQALCGPIQPITIGLKEDISWKDLKLKEEKNT